MGQAKELTVGENGHQRDRDHPAHRLRTIRRKFVDRPPIEHGLLDDLRGRGEFFLSQRPLGWTRKLCISNDFSEAVAFAELPLKMLD